MTTTQTQTKTTRIRTTQMTETQQTASPKSESVLPTTVRMPAPIEAARPDRGVPFGRLVQVELRKMLDTRAGLWLMLGIGLSTAAALVILFFNNGGQHSFDDYLQATSMPQALILPVVGILAVTAEWSQRTGLVTFSLEPRRARVAWAKLASSMAVGAAAVALAYGLAALAHQAAISLRGIDSDWSLTGMAALGAALYILLLVAQGVAFGMLFRNTPAAIVLYFALPTIWSILTATISAMESAAEWLDLNRTMNVLFMPDAVTGQQWAQLGTSVAAWVVLPLVVGMWRLTKAEVK